MAKGCCSRRDWAARSRPVRPVLVRTWSAGQLRGVGAWGWVWPLWYAPTAIARRHPAWTRGARGIQGTAHHDRGATGAPAHAVGLCDQPNLSPSARITSRSATAVLYFKCSRILGKGWALVEARASRLSRSAGGCGEPAGWWTPIAGAHWGLRHARSLWVAVSFLLAPRSPGGPRVAGPPVAKACCLAFALASADLRWALLGRSWTWVPRCRG